ncbi:MAG TPA: acetylglutamate kinase [Gemmatimonadaceae bacterium]|nr:acetylglutamate kinase [Gemmatimonadaceae bacterium]
MKKRFVIKLGGRVQSEPHLARQLADAWKLCDGGLCIVHGGGDEVTALQRQMGQEPSFIGGRRVTAATDIALLRMALSGSANKNLVASLTAAGVAAVGISGEDGGLIEAELIDESRLGKAGKPVRVRVRLLETLLDAGYMPVISPVSSDVRSTTGAALNVNGDDAAASIAAELKAELWLISDVPGVMDDRESVLSAVDPAQTEDLVARGIVSRGMQAKLEAGFAALTAGATGVRIAASSAITDLTQGTTLFPAPSLR